MMAVAAGDALDAAAIRAALGGDLATQIATFTVAQDTVSTQADALAIEAPAQGCAIVLAERQSGGQGRRGRRWITPAGASIACSLSRRFDRDAARMAGLSLAAGVALAEALHDQGYPQVRLKWPNDLLVDGRKLGGILVNLRADREACSAVIGFGINVRVPPQDARDIDQPWCDLAGLADPPPRNALVAAMLARLLPALADFDAEGLAPLLPRWQPLDALVGQSVQLVEGDTRHAGLCLGIAADGALRLRDAAGRVHDYYGGEASVRPA